MWEGRNRMLWLHTSSVLALWATIYRAPNSPERSPLEFDPYREETAHDEGRVTIKGVDPWALMKEVFVNSQSRR